LFVFQRECMSMRRGRVNKRAPRYFLNALELSFTSHASSAYGKILKAVSV
jgi:hypothetical protein